MKVKSLYTIVYDCENFIAVNKLSGISVGGDRWDESKERLDKLICTSLSLNKIFTVHRIDKETSGLVIFAKNQETHKNISLNFENRETLKKYIAVVHGRPAWKETVCDLPLVPNGNKKHMTIIDKYRGKKSLTRFSHLLSAGNYSVLEVFPETGRIHQIRVHAAYLGHPVVCDSLYGKGNSIKLSSFKKKWRGDPINEKPLLSRLGLHAAELSLPEIDKLTAPLQKDIASLLNQMEKSKS